MSPPDPGPGPAAAAASGPAAAASGSAADTRAAGLDGTAGSVRRLLRAMPKVDLHCHLDGSLRPETILELARERGVRLPADDAEGLRPHVVVGPGCGSLEEFLKKFDLIYPLLRDAAALERAAYELAADCAAENIRHVEARFAPALNATRAFTMDSAVSAVLKGLKRGLKDFGVSSGLIVCLYRSVAPRENRDAFNTLRRWFKPTNGLAEPGVVGMDLAGDEARFPTMEFAPFFEQARKLGIPVTCHAGETKGTANLQAAIALKVRRIGHGIRLMEDSGLLREVIRQGIPLEIGVTSNVLTRAVPSVQAHPAMAQHRSGVKIVFNTDDRGVIGIDLTHEFEAALEMGFTTMELVGIALGAVDHAFLPQADKVRLRHVFDTELRRLFE